MTLLALILRSSDFAGLCLWSVIGFFTGIALFFYGFRLLERRRLILDTPFSKIRSASMGMVEISGLASGPYTMIAPITARPCYYYRTQVWEWKQSGKNKTWVKVAGECLHLPFFVDDNTGRMLIDPRGAELDLHRDFEQEFSDSFFSAKEPAPENVRTFLVRHGVNTFNKLKVEEFSIKPKNSLFILGTLAENPGIEVTAMPVRDEVPLKRFSSQGFSLQISLGTRDADFATGLPVNPLLIGRSAAEPQVIRLSGSTGSADSSSMTQQQKVAAALLKAGISNPAAWAAAGLPGGTSDVQVSSSSEMPLNNAESSSSGSANDFDVRPPVILGKGTDGKPFLISWRSQQEVARALGWKCMLMIWGGPILSLVCLYFFLTITNLF
jgi:E3 Ubiquitin ligase